MATARLVPSIFYNYSGINYLTITDAANAYTNTDSDTFATVQNINSATTSRYIYLRGFNFSSIPDNAIVSNITIKIKAYHSGGNTGTIYGYNGTTQVSSVGSTTALGTSASVKTFTNTTISWDTLKGYGDNFGIRINCRRSNKNNTAYVYIYGAEINVTYTAEEVHVTGVDVSPATDSIEVGETTTLTATVSPSNATNKTVTWSTSNSSIATVSDGVVTGVAAGSARITATTQDGNYTDYCDITVTPAVTYDFVPASSMEVGKDYLISIGNSGSIYLLTDKSGGSRLLKGAAVTVSNGKITITNSVKSKALFSCVRYTSGNDNTITVEKDGKYLYCDNSTGLRMNAPATLDRFWHYRDNKFWQFKSTSSDGYSDTSSEYKYYLQMSGTNYTDNHVTSPSIAESTLPEIYIWVESSEPTYTLYYKSAEIETQIAYDETTPSDREDSLGGFIIYYTNMPSNETYIIKGEITAVSTTPSKYPSFTVIFNDDFVWERQSVTKAHNGIGVIISPASSYASVQVSLRSNYHYARGWYGLYKLEGGDWIPAIKVYKKVSGSWVEQNDLSTVFDSNIHYIKGN